MLAREKESWASPTLPHRIHLSCSDHNGHRGIYLVEWDGISQVDEGVRLDSSQIKDKVLPLIDSAASSYVGANTGWPKRTEACDKSSCNVELRCLANWLRGRAF